MHRTFSIGDIVYIGKYFARCRVTWLHANSYTCVSIETGAVLFTDKRDARPAWPTFGGVVCGRRRDSW
jgi:hypothetical protein